MSEVLYTVPIGILTGAITAFCIMYFASKLLKNKVKDGAFDLTYSIIDELVQQAQTDKQFQEKLFVVGAIVGKGIRYGFGDIMGKGTGKFKLNDIIGMVAQNVLPNILGSIGGQMPQQQPGQTPPPTPPGGAPF